jgi:hypothetical protein
VALDGEDVPGGRPLLEPVLSGGRWVTDGALEAVADLDAARSRCAAALGALPPAARRLEPREPDEGVWPVSLSAGLVELRDRLTAAREAMG